jgi:hypothetical protein
VGPLYEFSAAIDTQGRWCHLFSHCSGEQKSSVSIHGGTRGVERARLPLSLGGEPFLASSGSCDCGIPEVVLCQLLPPGSHV